MKTRYVTLAGFVLSLLFILLVECRATETKITRKDVPPAVIKAFEQAYPNAKVNAYSKEVERGVTYYELETVDGNTRRDLLYTADAKVAEIEETVSMNDLPGAVSRTFARESAGARASRIEKTTRGGKVSYEFGMGKGKPEIVIDSAGQVLSGSKPKTPKKK